MTDRSLNRLLAQMDEHLDAIRTLRDRIRDSGREDASALAYALDREVVPLALASHVASKVLSSRKGPG